MTRPTSMGTFAALAAFATLASACAEPQCPDGFDKIGKICRRHDGGQAVVATDDGDAGAQTIDGGAEEVDSRVVVEQYDAGKRWIPESSGSTTRRAAKTQVMPESTAASMQAHSRTELSP